MHKMIANVFKILGMSLILMFLLDMSLLAIDSINVNSRVTSLANVIQNEVARNNCLPDSLSLMFRGQLEQIVENSNVATSVETNFTNNLSVDGSGIIPTIAQTNPGNYGDLVTVAIKVRMSPWRIVMGRSAYSMNKVRDGLGYNLTYLYHTPCLRYLK